MTNKHVISEHHSKILKVDTHAGYFLISGGFNCVARRLSSFYVSTSRLRSCAVQVKDCAPVIAHTKERPDNEPVNGELQLKEPQWPCMLGIGLVDIKE